MAPTPTIDFLRDQLRRARVARNLSQEELGRLLSYSGSMVSAMEIGPTAPSQAYLTRFDTALETGGLFTSMLELIRRNAGPIWFRPWEELEREATALRWYEPTVVPGLLQTEGYARAMLGSGALIGPDEIEQLVTARLARPELLTGDRPPQFVAILDETALRRRVGDPTVMREQLEHLVTVGAQEHIQVRIVPAGVPWYTGLAGPFVLARFVDGSEAVYLDNQLRGEVVDIPAALASLNRRWEVVAGEALSHRQSADLITEVAKTWT